MYRGVWAPGDGVSIAAALIDDLADLSCENTNPGLVVTEERPDPAFYWKAVRDFCTIEQAKEILKRSAPFTADGKTPGD